MNPTTTDRWIENLGTVKVSQALNLLRSQSGGASGAQARESRKDRITLHNFAYNTNTAFVLAGPQLRVPAKKFTNAIRLTEVA
jgi:hypothetical protein